jgi:hypothetical protein
MKSIEVLPFTDDCRNKIANSISNYWRMARIDVVASIIDQLIEVKVHQKELVNDKILTAEELVARGESIFVGCIPEGYNVRYIPITYKP